MEIITKAKAIELNEMELESINGDNVLKSLETIAKSNYEYWGVKDFVDGVKDTAVKVKDTVKKVWHWIFW